MSDKLERLQFPEHAISPRYCRLKKRTWCFSLSLSLHLKPREKLISIDAESRVYRRDSPSSENEKSGAGRRRKQGASKRNPFSDVNKSSDYQCESGRKLLRRFGPGDFLPPKKRGKGRKRKVKRLFRLKGNEDARFPTRKRFLSIALRTKGENTKIETGSIPLFFYDVNVYFRIRRGLG